MPMSMRLQNSMMFCESASISSERWQKWQLHHVEASHVVDLLALAHASWLVHLVTHKPFLVKILGSCKDILQPIWLAHPLGYPHN
jgi:hypothetical protein